MSEEKTHNQLTSSAEAIRLPPRQGARAFPVAAVALMGIGTAVSAIFIPQPSFKLGLLAFAVALIVFAGLVCAYNAVQTRKKIYATQAVVSLVEHDLTPCFLADIEGNVAFRNETANEKFRDRASDTLSRIFADLFANPTSVLFRLQSKAQALGSAREDIVTRKGHIRLAVNAVEADMYLWRVEDLSDRGGGARAADALSLPMLTAGPTGTVLYMNEAFRRLLGGRAKNLSGVFSELPITSGHIHKVLCESGEIESLVAEVPSHGGRREIYLLPGDDLPDAAGTATDWDAIEELPVPLLKISASGEILSSNHEARVLLDNKIGSGCRMSDLLKGLGRPLTDWVTETVEGKGLGTAQFLEAVHENKEIHVQVSLNPAGSEDGTAYVVAVLSDVTEFKNLEMQFVQSQKMQAIGQLAGGVAHDFNNLLTAISGHCDLLLLRHDQGDGDFSDLVQIHENANRAAALVAQLLAYSRKQNLQPEVIDLRNTLSESTHLLNRLVGERLTLTLDHDPSLSPIRADKRQLEQVLMNLVVNARDAMPEGGNIRVETENTVLAEPLHRDRVTVPAGRYVVLRVRDTGIGIPDDKRNKIFEPFWTTKKSSDGTGLGLSTAYGIIKQTGGYIFVDSEVGVGTTFSILIPSHDAPIEHVEKAVAAKSPPISGDGVVLLVEDEAPVRAFASRALRLRGFTVLEADCAESALTMLSDPDLEVDLFLTDVIMPGKDGPTWVREALNERPDTKVVFVSGYAEEAFGEDQKSIPNSVFLPKPFSLNELTKTVHNQLH